MIFEYDNDDKKVETDIFGHNINEKTIMLEINSNVWVDDSIISFMKEHNDIDKQMDGTRFGVKYVASIISMIKYDRVIESKKKSKIILDLCQILPFLDLYNW